ncbi:MAG TPA: hypothetical protein VMU99_07015 [Acidimicrobiales bacterium]|nr:hypothetical protein [Acidimicrobiales bacterium]
MRHDLSHGIPSVLNLFGMGLTPFINAVLVALVGWVGSGTRSLLGLFGHALDRASAASFGAGFASEFSILRSFGAVLVGGFLCLVVIQAIIRQDLDLLVRVVVLRLPAALLLSGVAIEVVAMLMKASDAVSAALLGGVGGAFDHLVSNLSLALSGTKINIPVLSGFAGLAFAFVLAMVVLLCLLELVLRSAAISVAALFIPLALAGLVWPVTQHWMRRLGETLFALILSKVAIAAIFAFAMTSLGSPKGINMVLEGIALFALCVWAPFTLLHLLPIFETAAIGQLESISHRAGQARNRLSREVSPIVGDHLFPAEREGVDVVDGIGWAKGEPNSRIEVDPEDVETFGFLAPWVTVRERNAGDIQQDGTYARRPPSVIEVNLDKELDELNER